MNVLFLSNMIAEKGVWTIVEAAKILHEKNLPVEFHFVGKWSDITEEMFKRALIESHLEDVCFAHGGKYGKEKDGHINYVKGANVAGFLKVAKAMMAQGIV